MKPGYRIVTDHRRAPRDLVEALGAVPTAIISDNLGRLVAAGQSIRPMHRSGTLMGTALTVRTRPGDNLLIHKAVDLARPGDVIVVESGADLTNSLIGELIISHAVSRGVAGFVVDGAVRDLDFIGGGDIPVYAAGVTHRGPYKDGPGEIGVRVSLAGMVVDPGDVVVGDLDGVVAVRPNEAEALLTPCQQQVTREKDILAAIHGDGWERGWVDEILREKGYEIG
jgi:regulator of RNase E activity RraA